MINFKKGYTLAEVLVVMALLGILAAILLPAVSNVRPDRNKMMFKKAYHIAERIVYELVNDDNLYPSKEGKYYGLDNLEQVNDNGVAMPADSLKFCSLFVRRLNTVDDIITCTSTTAKAATNGTHATPTTTTTDGIDWYVPQSTFISSGNPTTATIYVDINGEKGPNCFQKSADPDYCPKPDIFRIVVKTDGKMYVDSQDTIGREYLKSNSTTR